MYINTLFFFFKPPKSSYYPWVVNDLEPQLRISHLQLFKGICSHPGAPVALSLCRWETGKPPAPKLGICLQTVGLQMLAAVLTGILELCNPELRGCSFWDVWKASDIRSYGNRESKLCLSRFLFMFSSPHEPTLISFSYAKQKFEEGKLTLKRNKFSVSMSWRKVKLVKTTITLNSSKDSGIIVYNTIYCISEARRFRLWGYN